MRRCRSGDLQRLGILLAQPHVRRSGLRKGMQRFSLKIAATSTLIQRGTYN